MVEKKSRTRITNEKHPTTEMRLDAFLSVYVSEIYVVTSGQRAGADLLLVFRWSAGAVTTNPRAGSSWRN